MGKGPWFFGGHHVASLRGDEGFTTDLVVAWLGCNPYGKTQAILPIDGKFVNMPLVQMPLSADAPSAESRDTASWTAFASRAY